jgi:uncharacterized protein (TIGR02302 family)
LRTLAYLVLTIEWIWPAIGSLLCVFGIFLIVSWLGVWIAAPAWTKVCIWTGLLVAFALSLRSLWFTHRPTEAEALRRLDASSRQEHRPAQAATDSLATKDDVSGLLWVAHLARAKRQAALLLPPDIRLRSPLKDPVALRAIVLLGVFAAGFYAGPEKRERVLAAFRFDQVDENVASRTDAWIDPPAYTGRPPVVLMTDGFAIGSQRSFNVPAGSEVVVRSQRKLNEVILSAQGLQSPTKNDRAEQKFEMRETSAITLKDKGGESHAFSFIVVPDKKPVIEFNGQPHTDGSGLLALSYQASDDYGVTAAEALLKAPHIRGRQATDPLFDRPAIPLTLPSPNSSNDGETIADLAESPWAGVDVKIQLVARDELGNEGFSSEYEIQTPQRAFTKPLAKAIIEQRRNIAFFPAEKNRALASLEALEVAPDRFQSSAGQHLAMHVLLSRLKSARSRDDLRDAIAFMWEMALRLEEGDLQSAEQELRAAENNLRNALENHAGEEEIRRLTNELRMAMERFLKELAERDRENEGEKSVESDRRRVIGSHDLNKSIDEIERMARSGNLDDAKNMLEQLKELLRNLKSARNGQQGRSAQESNKALNQLDQMLRDQQQLRDQTYNSNRDKDAKERSMDLKQRQGEIRQRLEELQRRMRQFGMRIDEGLEDAEGAMKDAEQHLGATPDGDGAAVDAQGRAIEGLKKGAESLARQRQEGGESEGEQAGGPPNGNGRDSGSDPLGRESRTRGDQSRSTYDPMGAAPPQRAQQLLEELRRRLGDPGRERLELDYLERLMRRY